MGRERGERETQRAERDRESVFLYISKANLDLPHYYLNLKVGTCCTLSLFLVKFDHFHLKRIISPLRLTSSVS